MRPSRIRDFEMKNFILLKRGKTCEAVRAGKKYLQVMSAVNHGIMGGSFSNYKLTQGGITSNEAMPEKTSEGLGTVKLSVGLRFNK